MAISRPLVTSFQMQLCTMNIRRCRDPGEIEGRGKSPPVRDPTDFAGAGAKQTHVLILMTVAEGLRSTSVLGRRTFAKFASVLEFSTKDVVGA